MKTSIFASLLVMAATAASPALAQEENGPNFTGVRFEARAGHDSFGATVTMTGPAPATTTNTGGSSNGKISYGAELGYDYQLGPVVVGAYAGVDRSNTSGCFAIVGTDTACVDSGRNIYAGARAGVVISGNLLVYGRGGYSRSRYSLSYDAVATTNSVDYIIADTAGGTHYGGGVEMAFTPNFYGRVEYVRTRYQRLDTENPLNNNIDVSIRTRRNQVSAAIGMRF